jgi:uncharacterized protein (TIGR02598 family)
MRKGAHCRGSGFSLVEVVLALGVVTFSVLATVGLLSVASDTNRRSRDETFAAQVVANEFARIRSLSAINFPTTTYDTRYYDSNLADLGTSKTADAVYELKMDLVTLTAPAAADMVFNAEVRYPANAAAAAQNVSQFTTLMNKPKP